MMPSARQACLRGGVIAAAALAAVVVLPGGAEAGNGRRGGGWASTGHVPAPRIPPSSGRIAGFRHGVAPAPAASPRAASPQRLTYAPPAPPPPTPNGVTWTPDPGAVPGAITRPVGRVAVRGYGYGYGWGWGWGGVPVMPTSQPPAPAAGSGTLPAVMTDPGFASGAAPTRAGNCPPPPPQVWIGGRLWIPDHEACDGTIVAGRWG